MGMKFIKYDNSRIEKNIFWDNNRPDERSSQHTLTGEFSWRMSEVASTRAARMIFNQMKSLLQ
jgi:hypothetical protein